MMLRKTLLACFAFVIAFLTYCYSFSKFSSKFIPAALTCSLFALLIDENFRSKRLTDKIFVWFPLSRQPLRLNHFWGAFLLILSLPVGILTSLNLYALSAGLILAFSYNFLRQADQCAPYIAPCALVVIFWLLWNYEKSFFENEENIETASWKSKTAGRIYLVGFIYGFLIKNHPISIPLGPLLFFLIWKIEKGIFKHLSLLLCSGLILFLGFFIGARLETALFLFDRDHGVVKDIVKSTISIDGPYASYKIIPKNMDWLLGNLLEQLSFYLKMLMKQITPCFLFLSPLGLWMMSKQKKHWAMTSLCVFILSSVIFLPLIGFDLSSGFPKSSSDLCAGFYIPSTVMLIWWMVYALDQVEKWRYGLVGVSAFLIGAPIILFFLNHP